jgi:hypothetical protein
MPTIAGRNEENHGVRIPEPVEAATTARRIAVDTHLRCVVAGGAGMHAVAVVIRVCQNRARAVGAAAQSELLAGAGGLADLSLLIGPISSKAVRSNFSRP